MATTDVSAAAILQAVQQSAQAAAAAAQALKEANERRSNGFGEASKVVQCPKEFGSLNSADDQTAWSDFSFTFRQWLFFADPAFESDFKHIEENPSLVVAFLDNPLGAASKERSKKLYSILAGILKQRPLKVLRQVDGANGLEVFRQLSALYAPRTKGRSLALLNALMSYPQFSKDRSTLEQVQNLEKLADEYRRSSGHDISDDILLSTLIRVLPKNVQQHVQLTMKESSTYAEVREQVVAHERISCSWTRDKVLQDLGATPIGAVTSYSSGDTGSAPMEVNLIKGKNKGKGKSSDKGKGKGKPNFSKGKGKGKYTDKGKGKGGSGKGYGDNSKGGQRTSYAGKVDANTCAYCGKTGHWQKDCHKKQRDMQSKQVRVVEEVTSETATTTASSGNVSSVRMVSATGGAFDSCYVEDLTVFSSGASCSSVQHVQMISETCVHFDMSCTDSDSDWIFSPDASPCAPDSVSDSSDSSCSHRSFHVRAVSDTQSSYMTAHCCDVILDSGADTSALPLSFAGVGDKCQDPSTTFVDAQGVPLSVESTRIATVQFGDVCFKEKFIIADVTSPLIALGHVIRSGWSLVQRDGDPCLVKGDKMIQVLYRNNSLCARGHISRVSEVSPEDAVHSIRVVQPGIVLRTLVPGWNRISPHQYAIRTTQPFHVNTTLVPSDELMWLRTTLVCREGSGWEVDEFCEAIADLRDDLESEINFSSNVVEVITIAHKHAMPAENLGFFMPDMSLLPPDPGVAKSSDDKDDVSSGYSASIAPDVPVDPAEGEPLQEDRVVPFQEVEFVDIDGVRLTVDSPLRALRAACVSLGLSKRGGKALCMRRMVDHLNAQTLMAAHGAEVKLRSEAERVAVGQKVPQQPTAQEIENHGLTHEPYRDWRELCQSFRARQDPHPASAHDRVGHSVISYDYGFCSRMDDGSDKLPCLVMHDRDTRLLGAIGGKYLQYVITEFVRFIMHTQHREVALRSDLEPTNLAILDGVRKTCRGHGITIHHEPVPVSDHQANGAAESSLQQIRSRAGIFIEQIEKACAGGKKVFPCSHPLYAWAILHSAWIHNHFVVAAGATAYERSSDRAYSGKLAMFGESVLGYLKTDRKAAARWQRGIWLGKSLVNDVHIVAQGANIFVTRSIRRRPRPFELEDLGEVVSGPWEFGYASLGHRMVYNKRLSGPLAFGVGAALPSRIDVEAIQVQAYAAEHPEEDQDAPPEGEAGQMLMPAGAHSSEVVDVAMDEHGSQKRGDNVPAAGESSLKKAKVDFGQEQPLTPKSDGGADVSERAPKTPRLDPHPDNIRSLVTSTDLSLYEHEDEPVKFHFDEQDLDQLEQYELEFNDSERLEEDDWSSSMDDNVKDVIKQLSFPYGASEPQVSDEELQRLDALADKLELQRLSKLNVLKDPSLVDASSKVLSTRFVRTWREKLDSNGSPIWLRRSRFVAREFAWLQPERESLFSPASSAITSRILPAIFLEMRSQCSAVLASLDVKDAFLTVDQQEPTLVHTTDAAGNPQSFSLGKVLPGQRDGSLLWYRDITSYLKSQLNMEEHPAYPCLLRSPDGSCAILIHVDDLLVEKGILC